MGDSMKKRGILKKILIVLLVIVIIGLGYLSYRAINNKVSNTFYYVVFDSNGGSRVETITVKLNEPAKKPKDPERKGYKFKYWTLDNVEYDFNTKVRNNLILVAKWEEDNKK